MCVLSEQGFIHVLFQRHNRAAAEPAIQFTGAAAPPEEPLSLWYRRPARQWVEALAVGNGRLGAMIFGGVDSDRIQFNEDSLWTGLPHDYARKVGKDFFRQPPPGHAPRD